MSQRLPLLESLPARELLARTSWAELNRLAGRYGVSLSGRRRDLAVERLSAIFEQPERLRAAAGLLSDAGRAVLRLILLLGAVEDDRDLAAARDRLLAVWPDSNLARAQLAGETQTLLALGLVFADRRRLVVPAEVLAALPLDLPAADAPPNDVPRSFATLRAALERLMAAIAETAPPAATMQRVAERLTAYRPHVLPPDAAAVLARQAAIDAGELPLLLSLLEALDAAVATRGRWQVGPGWDALRRQAPRDIMRSLLEAWLQPRTWTDLASSESVRWMCAPGVEGASVIALHESRLRSIIWRWLRGAASLDIDIKQFIDLAVALHPDRLTAQTSEVWIVAEDQGWAQAASSDLVAQWLIPFLLAQLRSLGLVVADNHSFALTPLTHWLDGAPLPMSHEPAIRSDGADSLLVDPLRAAAGSHEVLQLAGEIAGADGSYLRYRLTAAGVARLLEHGISLDAFRQQEQRADAERRADPDAQQHDEPDRPVEHQQGDRGRGGGDEDAIGRDARSGHRRQGDGDDGEVHEEDRAPPEVLEDPPAAERAERDREAAAL